jgi:hypothetical protein
LSGYEDSWSAENISPTKDSLSFVYRKDNWKMVIVKDGVESWEYDRFKWDWGLYSFDGSSFAFFAQKGEKWVVVKDWVESEEYDDIKEFKNFYLPNSNALVSFVKEDGKWFAVKWEQKSKWYDDIHSIVYASDGSSFAFVWEETWLWTVVKDFKEFTGYIDSHGPTYSPNGKNFAFVWSKWVNNSVLVNNDVEYYRSQGISDIIYAPDSNSISFVSNNSNWKNVVVTDGKELEWEYDFIDLLIYSPDGSQVAFAWSYSGNDGSFVVLVTNNRESQRYSYISSITHAPDGKSISFVAKNFDDKYLLVKDWEESELYDYVYPPNYSADSNSISFQAKLNDKMLLIKDWKEIKREGTLYVDTHSSKGNSFSFLHKDNNDKFRVVKDGKNSPIYDGINYLSYVWNTENISFLAMKDKKLFIVKGLCSQQGNEKVSIEWWKEVFLTIANIKSKAKLSKKIIVSKMKLGRTQKWKQYKATIEALVPKIPSQNLVKIYEKIEALQKKLEWNTSVKYSEIKSVLDYFAAKVWLRIHSDDSIEKNIQ